MALLNPETPAPPRHIAIIMDGNGRWAKKRGLPRTAGHAAGAEAFRRIANYCRSLGVEYLTVYAFSTENWKRSADEIAGIMKLLRRYLEEALADMEKNRVRFRFFGDLSKLSPDLQKLCRDAENRSEEYDVQVNFCLNYGGRDEIHFQEFISPVVEAMSALGLHVEFNGRNDLLIDGKKISGNAQYKLSGTTVHHGSILFDTDIEQMVRSTTVDDEKIISKSIRSVRERVTNIREHLPHPMTTEAFKEHMISRIMHGSDCRYEMTEEDLRQIRQIADERSYSG